MFGASLFPKSSFHGVSVKAAVSPKAPERKTMRARSKNIMRRVELPGAEREPLRSAFDGKNLPKITLCQRPNQSGE
jgi:hypothetical protein